MNKKHLLLLAGDGIGPEIMREVIKLIDFFNVNLNSQFTYDTGLIGGCAYDQYAKALSDNDLEKARQADAILLGAVGGPQWSHIPYEHRPESGLLRLRKELGLFANLRPAICYPALSEQSSLKQELIENLDILIVRELTGGIYFGEPKNIIDLDNGQKRAIDTQIYESFEIERIAKVAFELASTRQGKVTSMEKRNVMLTGVLWHEILTSMQKEFYPDIHLEHQLADSGAMQLVSHPKSFDVIVTDNLFGDLLSDISASLTGSLGLLPSASLGEINPVTQKRHALYEPVHGSAPDIAGQNIANPIAMIASFALCLRYSFQMIQEAHLLEEAIAETLADGWRTQDIVQKNTQACRTHEMGDALIQKFAELIQATKPQTGEYVNVV